MHSSTLQSSSEDRAIQLGRRDAITALEKAIHGHELEIPPESCPVEHFWAEGSYGRQITMPAGTLIVGKIHKHSHVNVISKGHCLVYTEQDGVKELVAPCTFVSHPYTKRVVYNIEETVWTTVHVTNATTEQEVEDEVIASERELECHGLQQVLLPLEP